MKILGVIPARYASTRFPGKPLAEIGGKTMIQRVYEQAKKSVALSHVVVATDHQGIFEHVKNFGGEVCMTRGDHASGTDRCYETLAHQDGSFEYVINIQGDEPFIQPEQIDLLAKLLNGKTEIATLVKRIEDLPALLNPNIVKAVLTTQKEALYFSRSAVPHIRNVVQSEWLSKHAFFKHIGMYGYRSDILHRITQLPIGILERAESLEQLRWLENGMRIAVEETKTETIGIDTPEDMEKAKEYLRRK
jgi:3-deoxy-manno-octulosonate cytidylyltransferase (CMP-KDO synthetase)